MRWRWGTDHDLSPTGGAALDTMFLAVAATEIEMAPLSRLMSEHGQKCRSLVIGVGPVESTLRLTRFLCSDGVDVRGIINFGVAGAYVQPQGLAGIGILDICLADREVAGDFGICYGEDMDYLPRNLTDGLVFDLDRTLLLQAGLILQRNDKIPHVGTFITVSGVSGTRARGENLRQQWQGLCENMEGASVARVAAAFDLPFLEVRCISNMVEDRNPQNWRLHEACTEAAATACTLIGELEL